ncbi:guanine nucleotide-releasing factor 2 isoform X1 [Frankliniella occidentalis]|uniref:CRK SH3-binding GNRP n=1 Tax=Frankliniella occidentalis TaxID=133901 RepID=A0A6J1SQT7_FRAOC|nr:guanine nucleotide-releasing factor 2 isoform X1 [Frankliniella occidentalis]
MSGTPKHDRQVSESDVSPGSGGPAGPGAPGPGGGSGLGRHGGSFHGKPRGSRLARRARSFKDDFLEILSQMRSPGGGPGGGGGSSGGSGGSGSAASRSPQSPKARTPVKATKSDAGDGGASRNPLQDLDAHVRQVQFALKHFRDVVSNNKLEVLPGNGTVVLETVATIHSALKTCLLNEQGAQSSILVSATNQVYQSMAQLIKLCDDVLLNGGKSLNTENVAQVIQLVEEAVLNLVTLAREKLASRHSSGSVGSSGSAGSSSSGPLKSAPPVPQAMDRKSSYSMAGLELPQRSSLPDIPLTPRERQILEQTSQSVIERHHHHHANRNNHHHHHHSQSSDSVLLDTVDGADVPPPKPPLPAGRPWCLSESSSPSPCGEPPPLPPKRRPRQSDGLGPPPHASGLGPLVGLEGLSLRSKSPEDTSSLLSASAGSLDSVLNHSRDEEEELRALMEPEAEHDTDRADSHSDSLTLAPGPSPGPSPGRSSRSSRSPCTSSGGHGHGPGGTGPSPWLNRLAPGTPKGAVNGGGDASPSSSPSPCCCWEGAGPEPPDHVHVHGPGQTQSQHMSASLAESGFASMHSIRYASTSSQHRSSQQSSVSITSQAVMSQSQRTVSVSSSSSSSTTRLGFTPLEEDALLGISAVDDGVFERISPASNGSSPPALPQKNRFRQGPKRERLPSQYDNVPGNDTTDSPCLEVALPSSSPQSMNCSLHATQITSTVMQSQSHSALQVSSTSPSNLMLPAHKSAMALSGPSPETGKPPPLPLKKKHMFQSVAYSVMAYMEMFGNCSHTNNNDFLRHSMHTYNVLQTEWQQRDNFTAVQSRSFYYQKESLNSSPSATDVVQSIPPALPPKRSRTSSVRSVSSPPPSSPVSNTSANPPALKEEKKKVIPPRLDLSPKPPLPPASVSVSLSINSPPAIEQVTNQTQLNEGSGKGPAGSSEETGNPLEELDVTRHLVVKKSDEDGPDIRGGHEDGLVVHATKANKNEENETDFLYQEAFLTTYRTFLSPLEVIQKLCFRHQRFHCSAEVAKQRAAKESFSLLVRVVSDLTISDLDDTVLQTLMNFTYQLLSSGDLTMAKALRVKILEKHSAKMLCNTTNTLLPSQNVYTRYRQASLLDFKSEQIAEQMTLLDAQLFMKIEIPEVLIWAQEQNEERSPNLTRFTEHFNKMSYWARSRILEQAEAKDRERYVVKFIKIMKHLRKMNNFNSYLALLSALDSAPIRRLEWQKHITEGLKEYCALIDSSSSFRAYRQALADTNPPCIPYIGLVLQDLTFVHIGNSDLLADGTINFSKRWQQFNIVENMKRFKKGTYSFKKQERIIAFFSNFDEFLSEEAMWQISESIKPRGGRKTNTTS